MTELDDAAAHRSRRSRGMSYQEVLDTDTHEVPPVLRLQSDSFLGDHDVPVDRFIDRAYHELEKKRLWPFVWQMACREEEIPNPGDTCVYDIVDTSILVVRTEDGVIKAYYNVCQHQGRRLRDHDGPADEFRCPYHGWCWHLDGTLRRVPSRWDYPTVKRESFSLKEVRAETWGGFVFVNMDPEAQPLLEFLGDIDQHFERYPLEDRFIAAHTVKYLECNWKTAQEAFMEGYHTIATHPQILAATGDEMGQYDAFGNYSRAINITGIASPSLRWTPTANDMAALAFNTGDPTDDDRGLVPDGMSFREWGAQAGREQLRPVLGDAVDELCDSELMDAFFFTVFPNFHPWAAYNQIVYRFRPYGDEHEKSIMDTYILAPFSGERPPPAKPHILDFDESHLDAPELGALAEIFYQDELNMPQVQRGMHTLRKVKPSGVTYGVYQYNKIRHFHNLYEDYLGVGKDGETREEDTVAGTGKEGS
ncbi:Rieske 2Fe-2S domain-containing protein [Actinomadura sp. LD22]|uniref:Rieske 2Fe-2S domain-containing protein n=1 Tax=Actinomadura physcomitrii TaxID=2650748 RepID=A0A6I4MGF9_9ACTN|nr:aromatic ring-hydroxylating dioxygenase subunit alpha [Actinomadura physcomitrii]MWA04872.1 Rieske 2Fe-2S domain-containing protein [Actinomadura physcomitrii]